jgi:hypothetical protein
VGGEFRKRPEFLSFLSLIPSSACATFSLFFLHAIVIIHLLDSFSSHPAGSAQRVTNSLHPNCEMTPRRALSDEVIERENE